MAANQHGMHAAAIATVTKRPGNCQPATWRLSMRQHKAPPYRRRKQDKGSSNF